MSDEQFFCEYCGHSSTSPTQCTNCGKDITDFVRNPPRFIQPISGKLTLRPYERSRAEEAWKALAELWDRLERETNLCIWPSQMDKFPPQGDVLELYGSTAEIGDIHKHLPGMFTCEFQELPESEIPKHPPTPRFLEILERIKRYGSVGPGSSADPPPRRLIRVRPSSIEAQREPTRGDVA